MAMTQDIQAAIKAFRDIILDGVPHLLTSNETAFLSFMCSLAGLDALSGYRYDTNDVSDRFPRFICDYFPTAYSSHAAKLYLLRCRMLHNFSPAYFTLIHASPEKHLSASTIGDTILSDVAFFNDLRAAAETFLGEVVSDPRRQDKMNARLTNLAKGGAIHYGVAG